MENKKQESSGKVANAVTKVALSFMAFAFSNIKNCKRYLKTVDGWSNFSIGLRTEDGKVAQSIWFCDGKATVKKGTDGVDTELILQDTAVLAQLASVPPNEVLNLMLKNKMASRGNMTNLQQFNMLISVLMKNKQIKQMAKQKADAKTFGEKIGKDEDENLHVKKQYVKVENVDSGVKFITDDPYLSEYSIEDFPRLQKFLDIHFCKTPAVCTERALILTNYFRKNGFETKNDGSPWVAELRQGNAYKNLMENKKPIIRQDDLIAGTTTTKEIGVPIYPDGAGTLFWGELLTVSNRMLNAYDKLTEQEITDLNENIFPYWRKRNFREWVRETYDSPLCQQLDERWAATFLWKTVALSHTIIDYPKLLQKGLTGIIAEIKAEMQNSDNSQSKNDTLTAMLLCYEGIIAYSRHLAEQCRKDALAEKNPIRKKELEHLAEVVMQAPEFPSRTLDEAVNAIWIFWISIHMESTNAGFSIGRLDQFLQPYFESDISKLATEEERKDYVKHAIEMVGCFYMRCTDHLPTIPDIGNYLFGGSSSDQAITVGGVTPDGEDAVNDMTYIVLKTTEILAIRDPNVNARYNNKKNSKTYLKRLCEVNVNTTATPSIHNDEMVMKSLEDFHYPAKDLNNWSATGCVEPTLSGKHLGHTNCMMFNMVAALEMALFNGYHPLMRWNLGPKTGDVTKFAKFDDFFNAFSTQLKFLAGLACQYNNYLGEAHSVVRPTPMMSAVIDGCIEKGLDCTKGGALYNTSGIACIGLADIVDSLMSIKKLVFEQKKYTMKQMCDAIKVNFVGFEAMRKEALNSVPLFGSGSEEAIELANRVTKFVKDLLWETKNFRGGRYTAGFWSMSNHVAFGTLTGALPSGRLAGKPFTPGLTPQANASKSLLDNIKDVARLEPKNMNNNIAFNVKVSPSAHDTHEQTVNNLYTYAKAYADLGGMQIQFNVVSSKTMRAAMKNPDEYRDLLVRISGYNAYFTTLNRDLQMELINRADYNM